MLSPRDKVMGESALFVFPPLTSHAGMASIIDTSRFWVIWLRPLAVNWADVHGCPLAGVTLLAASITAS